MHGCSVIFWENMTKSWRFVQLLWFITQPSIRSSWDQFILLYWRPEVSWTGLQRNPGPGNIVTWLAWIKRFLILQMQGMCWLCWSRHLKVDAGSIWSLPQRLALIWCQLQAETAKRCKPDYPWSSLDQWSQREQELDRQAKWSITWSAELIRTSAFGSSRANIGWCKRALAIGLLEKSRTVPVLAFWHRQDEQHRLHLLAGVLYFHRLIVNAISVSNLFAPDSLRACVGEVLGFGDRDLRLSGPLPWTLCTWQRTSHQGWDGFGTISTD